MFLKLECCWRNVLELVIEFLGGRRSVFEDRMLLEAGSCSSAGSAPSSFRLKSSFH